MKKEPMKHVVRHALNKIGGEKRHRKARLARILGVSYVSVMHWEKGRVPQPAMQEKLKDFVNSFDKTETIL